MNGGFPVAYIFDTPGVSVEHQLSFVEDTFCATAFIIDVAFYFIIVLCLFVAKRYVSQRKDTCDSVPPS